MTAFLLYQLKVIVCAGILFLYYLLALRNKRFHQWNRFYLLAAVVISLVAPLIRFTVYHPVDEKGENSIQLLQAVESTNVYLEEITVRNQTEVSSDQWMSIVYVVISGILLLGLLYSVIKIWSIVRSHKNKSIGNIQFVSTNIKGTPFSFLHYIFWNEQIDIQSQTGQQIFQHELVHVKEKHTLDQLFMRAVLIFCWSNPFFWLIRMELKMVHEFIADKKSVAEHGTAALAAMILQASYPSQFNSLTSQYFQTSIKRRIHMLSQIKNPKLNYLSRVLALPIIALTVFAFTVRSQQVNSNQRLDHPITVVIDAGHGMENGQHTGAMSENLFEDEIMLSLAKKIAEQNHNEQLKIILTRTDQSIISLQERVDTTKKNKADLFISLHLDAVAANQENKPETSGMEILIPNKNPGQVASSKLLATALASEIGGIYKVNNQLQATQSVYVLNYSPCASVLLECGFITNQRDREFITKNSNQELLARKILAAIEAYAVNQSTGLKKPGANESKGNNAVTSLPEHIAVDTPKGKVFTTVDQKASINSEAWRRFLDKNLGPVTFEINKLAPAGYYTVKFKFIVEKDGSISSIETVNDPGFGISDLVLKVIKNSPKWTPALVKGKPVRSYYFQPINFIITEEAKEDSSQQKLQQSGNRS